jgi:hypothetical protein
MDDSLANKTSWSPIITVIGDPFSGRNEFINRKPWVTIDGCAGQRHRSIIGTVNQDRKLRMIGKGIDRWYGSIQITIDKFIAPGEWITNNCI